MKKKSFTLIEVLTSLFIVAVGLAAVFSVINSVFSATAVSVNRMTASYLAQEGIEVVRNIRDSNWLNDRTGITWNSNMNLGSASEGDYNDSILVPYTGKFLEVHPTGFYEYPQVSNGYTQSVFKRKITVTSINATTINVRVEILWTEKGKNYNVVAEEELYNWI